MLEAADVETLGDISRLQAQRQPDHPAFVFEGTTTSFAELDRHAIQVARGLAALGLQPGSRVCYLGKNSPAYFEVLLGCAKAGVVMTPINWRLAGPEVAYIIEDCDGEVLFFGREFAGLALALAPDLPSLRACIAIEGQPDGATDYRTWRNAQNAEPPPPCADRTTTAVQLYTSGTTGRPKGALLPHRAFFASLTHLAERPAWSHWTAEDVSLLAMPIGHIGGTGWGIQALLAGATSVVMREFDPDAVLAAIETYRISKIFMVPAAMQIVVRRPHARNIDWSCMKYMLYGASPIPLDLLKECMAVFGCQFVQLYGMTETCGTVVVLEPEDHNPEGSPRMRSAGRPMHGVELAILDPEGQRVGVGNVGEIAIRSEANMTGYWKQPEATARTIAADGWLRTGDAGYLDADGFLYIHDRIKDMIISGGENIYPAEVENAIFGHPEVADVAVIGVPDAKWGESVKAMVVRAPDSTLSEAQIIAWARQRIAGYKAPRSVDFIEALPRNASGKILRRSLREPYWQALDRQVS
jgi:acyl-CoA synthetase (AMP-forming)/AMP-acid ligase II